MRGPIFKKEDFTLCKVPVPKGYPQSQTHCGVGYFEGKYYLTTSPYPVYKRSKLLIYFLSFIKKISFGHINMLHRGEDYENPCLYVEESRNKKGIPIEYKLLGNGPLMQKPIDKYGLGSYCSDPDLYIEEDNFYILNRTSFRKGRTGIPTSDYETTVHLISFKVKDNNVIDKSIINLWNDQDASPCITKYRDNYIYFSLLTNSYNDGSPCKALFLRTSKKIQSGWTDKISVSLKKGNYEPWHMSVFCFEGKLYSIISCIYSGSPHRCWTMLGEFNNDLTELIIYETPLTSFNSYRSSALVNEAGEFILYNTTINESIIGGHSVDGREIVMAHMPFSSLLRQLKVDTTK